MKLNVLFQAKMQYTQHGEVYLIHNLHMQYGACKSYGEAVNIRDTLSL